jgi:hypothetical protein
MVLPAFNPMLQIRDSILILSDTDSNPNPDTAQLASKRRMKKFSCFEQFGALGERQGLLLVLYKSLKKSSSFGIFDLNSKERNLVPDPVADSIQRKSMDLHQD